MSPRIKLSKIIIAASLVGVLSGANAFADPKDGKKGKDNDTVVATAMPGPMGGATHKVVCRCNCGSSVDVEDHDVPSGGCGKLDGTTCSDGIRDQKLSSCTKRSVPASTAIDRQALAELLNAVSQAKLKKE